jgi:cytochrome c biogenesis protein CcmG/thiol:disulfide interchange protein DsbE
MSDRRTAASPAPHAEVPAEGRLREAPQHGEAGGIVPPAPGSARRFLVLLPVLVFVALAILFAFRLGAGDPSRVPSALIGRPVPDFALPPLPGGVIPGLASRDLKGGGVTIVNVWASWCGPCRIEHPLLMDLAKQPGLRLVGMSYKDKPEASARFLQLLGNPFSAIGVDESGRTGIDWGVYGVPETFIVGSDGTIRHKHVGPLTPEAMPAFRAALAAAR